MTPVLHASRLTKRFGDRTVLTEVDLDVVRGECIGIEGAPGSGRTTLLEVLATLLPPSSGVLEIDGVDTLAGLEAVRRKVAFVGTAPPGLPGLDARECLRFVAATRGAGHLPEAAVAAALARVGVSGRASAATLPRRFQRRLVLEAALLSRADLVFVDRAAAAPNGGDHDGLVEWMRTAATSERAVIVVTEASVDIRAACTRVMHLHDGRLVPDSHARPAAAAAHGVVT